MPNHYEVLGIPLTASSHDIRKAFRKLSLKYHPDKTKNALDHERFLTISNAYEVLSNPTLKSEYDRKTFATQPRSQGSSFSSAFSNKFYTSYSTTSTTSTSTSWFGNGGGYYAYYQYMRSDSSHKAAEEERARAKERLQQEMLQRARAEENRRRTEVKREQEELKRQRAKVEEIKREREAKKSYDEKKRFEEEVVDVESETPTPQAGTETFEEPFDSKHDKNTKPDLHSSNIDPNDLQSNMKNSQSNMDLNPDVYSLSNMQNSQQHSLSKHSNSEFVSNASSGHANPSTSKPFNGTESTKQSHTPHPTDHTDPSHPSKRFKLSPQHNENSFQGVSPGDSSNPIVLDDDEDEKFTTPNNSGVSREPPQEPPRGVDGEETTGNSDPSLTEQNEGTSNNTHGNGTHQPNQTSNVNYDDDEVQQRMNELLNDRYVRPRKGPPVQPEWSRRKSTLPTRASYTQQQAKKDSNDGNKKQKTKGSFAFDDLQQGLNEADRDDHVDMTEIWLNLPDDSQNKSEMKSYAKRPKFEYTSAYATAETLHTPVNKTTPRRLLLDLFRRSFVVDYEAVPPALPNAVFESAFTRERWEAYVQSIELYRFKFLQYKKNVMAYQYSRLQKDEEHTEQINKSLEFFEVYQQALQQDARVAQEFSEQLVAFNGIMSVYKQNCNWVSHGMQGK